MNSNARKVKRKVPARRLLSPVEREVLRRFKALLQERVRLHSLVLFGSRARVDAAKDSDMDVLVVLHELSPDAEDRVSRAAWEAGIEAGVVIVPATYSKDEWEKGPERASLLALAVRKEGIAV